jgi:hypothetical protein
VENKSRPADADSDVDMTVDKSKRRLQRKAAIQSSALTKEMLIKMKSQEAQPVIEIQSDDDEQGIAHTSVCCAITGPKLSLM